METLHPSVHLSRGFCGEGWQHGVMLCVVWGLGVALLMWGLPVIKGHLCQKYLSVVSSFTWGWGQGEDGGHWARRKVLGWGGGGGGIMGKSKRFG